jgi:FkbM family methyltransferase
MWKKFHSTCTPEFSQIQEKHFLERMLNALIPLEGPIGCQECDDVLDLFSRLSPCPHKTFVEIGANKGYDLLSLYTRWTNFSTNLVWMRTGLPPGCPYYADVDRHVFPRVIAAEPSPPTFAALTGLFADLPVCNLELHRVAISNAPGRAVFRSGTRGSETSHLRWHGSAGPAHGNASLSSEDIEVNTETIDGFLDRLSVPHVEFLAIGTEGLDPLVLDGAGAALAAGRIDLLSFEFSNQWAPGRFLSTTVRQLDGRGYDCFYVGYRVLVKLSGDGCWSNVYDRPPQFANILCARRAFELAETLLAPFGLANPSRYDPGMLL